MYSLCAKNMKHQGGLSMKKISLFLVVALIVSLCGCTFASHKEENTSQLTGEELTAYTSLIKARLETKTFLRYDMKLEAYDSIKQFVFKFLNEIDAEDMPFYCTFSKDDTHNIFQFCVSFDEEPVSDLIEYSSLDSNISSLELIIVPSKETHVDETSILNQLDTWRASISVTRNQFEASECAYYSIEFEK